MDITPKLIKSLSIIILLYCFTLSYAEQPRYWIYFNDKTGSQTIQLSNKTMERRALRGALSGLSTIDINPSPEYVARLKAAGLQVHVISRWLNAASVSGDSSLIQAISNQPFVKRIAPVATFKGNRLLNNANALMISENYRASINYGQSYSQNHIIQIDSLHSLGYSGSEVIIGIMDTGFDLAHPAFDRIIHSGRLIATHDFINNDNDVQDTKDPQQGHGTATWSVTGGYVDGTLIGSGYSASYVLAKTEIVSQEIQAEEDYWIAAAEWMDSIGVDIITSSLGYTDWYTQSQLDGHTCAITNAAEMAAASGIAVVNCAGNERNNAWNAVVPPADGDSVIAAGAINPNGTLSSFSSPGPTADGRIKPDIMAQGAQVWAANYLNESYTSFGGTSMSSPQIAGGLAAILEAHPNWNLDKLYGSLRQTGSSANLPDNNYGWGIARFFDQFAVNGFFTLSAPTEALNPGDTLDLAIALFDSSAQPGGTHNIIVTLEQGSAIILSDSLFNNDSLIKKIYCPLSGIQKLSVNDEISNQRKKVELTVSGSENLSFETWPNPAIGQVVFVYSLPRSAPAKITVFSVAGDKIDDINIAEATLSNSYIWRAKNAHGEQIASGIYIAYLKTIVGCRTIKFAFINN